MILLVFVAAVMVSVVLERQARRHRYQRAREYERLGIPIPPPRPKLKRTEAWLNIGLGFLLVAMSLSFAWSEIQMANIADRMPEQAGKIKDDSSLMIQAAAFYLASGIALVWLGWKAVREITRYESGAASVSATTGGGEEASGGRQTVRRSIQLNTTAAIAAGAFVAGILTGYIILSRESPTAPAATAGQATVSLDIQGGKDADLPPGFADELERRFEAELSTLPGVRVIRTHEAAFLFKARLGRDDGFIVVSWNVVRTRDNAPYFSRRFTIPAGAPENPLRIMISALSSTFGGRRTTAEFERILQLPENSLD